MGVLTKRENELMHRQIACSAIISFLDSLILSPKFAEMVLAELSRASAVTFPRHEVQRWK
jgi:hypothetical protein